MLRKPDKNAPLPAFARDEDEDESASTGEYRPVVHALPSFPSSDDLPRFPSMIDPRELGGEPLPSFASLPDPGPRPHHGAPPASRKELVKLGEMDVAATLEKKPMTARAANRILAQLDRIPQRPDETGEIDLEDVLEEVYAEPAPASRKPPASTAPRPSESPAGRRSEPAPASRRADVGPGSTRVIATGAMVPAPPPSFTGADFPLPAPRSTSAPPLPASRSTSAPAPPLAHAASPAAPSSGYPPALAVSQSAPLSYPPSPSGYPPSPSGYPNAPQHSAAAYAHTVPAGYVLVPEASLASQNHALPLMSDAALVRPLPLMGEEPKPPTSVLTKLLAGGLLLGLSALAGGAASMFLLPDKAPEVPAPAATAPPSVALAPTAPPSVPSAPATAATVTAAPSVMAPTGTGWPLAPGTVPPGAASLAPPPPSGTESAPAAPAPAAPSASAPSSASAAISPTMGRIVFGPARTGHRVWVDGAMAGESTAPILVKCGKRHVRIGSSAGGQAVNVPCGGEVTVK